MCHFDYFTPLYDLTSLDKTPSNLIYPNFSQFPPLPPSPRFLILDSLLNLRKNWNCKQFLFHGLFSKLTALKEKHHQINHQTFLTVHSTPSNPFLFDLLHSNLYKKSPPTCIDLISHECSPYCNSHPLPIAIVHLSKFSPVLQQLILYLTVLKIVLSQFHATVQRMIHWFIRKITEYINI